MHDTSQASLVELLENPKTQLTATTKVQVGLMQQQLCNCYMYPWLQHGQPSRLG